MYKIFGNLSPEEEALPYAKYFHRQPAQPDPHRMALLSKGPMDPAKATPLSDINSLLTRLETTDEEIGYCVLPDGAGYVGMSAFYPDCTVDMFKWWFAWHPLNNLRYRIWCPRCHAGIAVSSRAKEKILDPNVPLEEKIVDVDHFVMEDIGGGLSDIVISFLRPENMGFDKALLESSGVTVIGGYGLTEPREGPAGKVPAVMMHLFHEENGGVRQRTRFYMGCRINKGIPMNVLPHGVQVPIVAPMGLAYHNVEEFTNLGSFLPQIYAELGGTFE